MAELPNKFAEFLSDIRPTEEQINDYIQGHETLRERLTSDDELSKIHVGDFLQGSYARSTAVRPVGDEKSDVDVAFVTNLLKDDYTPSDAMELCEPFLDRYYRGRWETNQRSYQIELSNIEIDLVLTAAPSEAIQRELTREGSIGKGDIELMAKQGDTGIVANMIDATFKDAQKDWREEPLDIPDRELEYWDETHPWATIDWTRRMNDRTDGHYVNVVKAIKWWRRNKVDIPKHPKSYPLERIIAECCPTYISSVAEGVSRTFNVFLDKYESDAKLENTPTLGQHGLPEKNVLSRITGQDFAAFYDQVIVAAEMANQAIQEPDEVTAAQMWRNLFGEKFPLVGEPDDDSRQEDVKLSPPSGSTNVSSQRFG